MHDPDGGDEQDEKGRERRLAWTVLLSLPVEIEQSRRDEQKRERDRLRPPQHGARACQRPRRQNEA